MSSSSRPLKIATFSYKELYDHFHSDSNTKAFRKQDNSTLAFAIASMPMVISDLPSEIKREIIPLASHFKKNDPNSNINNISAKVTSAYVNLIALKK